MGVTKGSMLPKLFEVWNLGGRRTGRKSALELVSETIADPNRSPAPH